MKTVYLLQSIAEPQQRYVGIASDIESRLEEHNAGKSPHTSKHKPWKLVAFIGFEGDGRAVAFEQYLKSGSGHAFANKHLW